VGAAPDRDIRLAVHERVERFAALRSAQRALAPSVREAGQLFSAIEARDLLERLRSIARAPAGEEEADASRDERAAAPDAGAFLREIDERLDEVASRLLDALDAVSIAQLRATLPTTAVTYPEEVVALLNLCAGSARGHAQRLRVTEYVLTLLSSDLSDGVRSLARDPDEISRGVALLCRAHRDKLGPGLDPEDVAMEFRSAAADLQGDGEIQATLEEMRALKERLGEAIFLPEILRDAVAYNIAVWNRQEELLDAERTSDRIAEADLLFAVRSEGEAEAEDSEEEAEAEPPDEAPGDEELALAQASGIAQVEASIARRVRGEELGADLPSMLAAELDPWKLGDRVRAAFTESSDDPADALIRTIVATASVLQQLPEGGERLRSLELTPTVVKGDWIRHLSQEVQATMRKLVTAGRYEDARSLSAIKHKFLYSSLTNLIRERAKEVGTAGVSASRGVEGARDAIGLAAAESDRKRQLRQLQQHVVERSASYVGILLIILIASFVMRVALVRPRPIHIFSSQELANVSPLMASGYRGASGASPLFIGTVNAQWQSLEVEEQRAQGAELVKQLAYKGVQEVILYDNQRKLQFHFVGGTVRHPRPPDG
jgi:hypothetical protein